MLQRWLRPPWETSPGSSQLIIFSIWISPKTWPLRSTTGLEETHVPSMKSNGFSTQDMWHIGVWLGGKNPSLKPGLQIKELSLVYFKATNATLQSRARWGLRTGSHGSPTGTQPTLKSQFLTA